VAFDLNTAVPADALPAPAAARPKFDLSTAQPADEPTVDMGPDGFGLFNRLKNYGAGVAGAILSPNPHAELPSAPRSGVMPGIGALEGAASALTGLVSPATGAAVTAYHRLTDNPDYPLAQGAADATYTPRTRQGAQTNEALGAIFQPVGDLTHALGAAGGAGVGELGGSPRAQADTGTLIEQALNTGAAFMGGRGRVKAPEAALPGEINTALHPAGDTVARMRGYGMQVPPDVAAAKAAREAPPGVQPSVPGTIKSTLVNQGELHGRMGIENAKKVEGILRTHFGLPEGTPLTPEMLRAKADALNPAYDAVAKELPVLQHTPEVQAVFDQLGSARRDNVYLRESNPKIEELRARVEGLQNAPTQQALEAIGQWREDARALFQSTDSNATAAHQAAKAYRKAADGLEQAIANQVHDPVLYKNFENARVQKAQIHNVLDAWSGQEIDPQALARLGQDVKLTGGLAQIADAATQMPSVVRSTTGTTLSAPSNAGTINVPESMLRRFLFDKWMIPHLMSDSFQSRLGAEGSHPTMAPQELPTANPAAGPRPPSWQNMGTEQVPFELTPPGPTLAGMAPGVQPGASVGLADALMTDPHGTANPWPQSRVPGEPITLPDNMRIAPDNAHELPGGLSDLLAPQAAAPSPMTGLPPALQAIADLVLNRPDILQPLVEALGLTDGPPGPMAPPKGTRGLRSLADALHQPPSGVAGPEDFQ
jgi:hypothetical protein